MVTKIKLGSQRALRWDSMPRSSHAAAWGSSDETVAKVIETNDYYKWAVVSGVAAGNATITATLDGVSGTHDVTVVVGPATVTVAISGQAGPPRAIAGETLILLARARNGDLQFDATAATWATSDAGVVSVPGGATGDAIQVTAVAAGTATITATLGAVNGTIDIEVVDVPDSVSVNEYDG